MSATPSPASTRIFWIRHGETAWNTEKRFQGHLDIPLNEIGQRQARKLAARWATAIGALTLPKPDQIYASDLARASNTARAIADTLGMNVNIDSQLRERNYGQLAGLTADEMARQYPDIYQGLTQRQPHATLPEGETLQGFYDRIIQSVFDLMHRHPNQTLCVVAHGGVLDCVYRHAMGIDLQPPRNWLLANASVNCIDHVGLKWTIERWGDTRHLDGTAADEVDGRVT